MNRAERRRQQRTAAKSIRPGAAPNVQANLQQALSYHRAGRLQEAERVYDQILRDAPRNADARHLRGVIANQTGRPETAVELIERAIAVDSTQAMFHSNLGNALTNLGKPEEALDHYGRALDLVPNFADAHCNHANALVKLGRFVDGEAESRRALAVDPNYAAAYGTLGNTLEGQQRLDDAATAYRRALAINPAAASVHCNLSSVLRQQDHIEESIAGYRRALGLSPNMLEGHIGLGNALKAGGEFDQAMASYRRALEIDRHSTQAHNNLGNLLKEHGELDEAVACFRRALECDPGSGEIHRHLAFTRKHTERDDEIRTMENLLADPTVPDREKKHLCFALGKSAEDLGQYDESFAHLLEGNRLRRSELDYDIMEDAAYMQHLKAVFAEPLFSQLADCGCKDSTPIFIVGMPRSGTTLVEQILASHPQVCGAGELSDLKEVITTPPPGVTSYSFPESVRTLEPDSLARMGGEYVRRLRRHAPDATMITDKMPHNFLYAGMIRLVLPHAKVIHCRRDPVDTCLSCFKNYFVGIHEFAYDLTELGQYYKLYQNLMSHWQTQLPDFMLDIHYEDLVADQEGRTRELLDFCGLDWDESCLSFQNTKRAVRTASSAQVRRPIYNSSIRLWKKYEKQLRPLLHALDEDTVPRQHTPA